MLPIKYTPYNQLLYVNVTGEISYTPLGKLLVTFVLSGWVSLSEMSGSVYTEIVTNPQS